MNKILYHFFNLSEVLWTKITDFSRAWLRRCPWINAWENLASWLGILIGSFHFLHLLRLANNIKDVFVSKRRKMQPADLAFWLVHSTFCIYCDWPMTSKMSSYQSAGNCSQLTWHSDWFVWLSASIAIGQWHQRCLPIKAQKNAASWLGILIGSFDCLHLLRLANMVSGFIHLN